MNRLNIRGSIAVEAALIVPIVIITVMILLYLMLLIFQTSIMQTTANKIAERTAATYFYPQASFYSGQTSKKEISNLGLYRRWGSNNIYQQQNFQSAVLGDIKRFSILKSRQAYIDIKHSNKILKQDVTVTLNCTYDNPLGSLTAVWGLKKKINLNVQATATIDDPAEFIRNTDFIIDTASKVPAISQFESKWQGIINKVIQYINKVMKG